MIEGKRVLALIPARGGSKGLPGKNLMPLLGRPLVAWAIRAALDSRYVDRTVVSTDNEEIAACAERYGAAVPFRRPAELAGDDSTSADVVLHALHALEERGESYEMIALLEPTSPTTDGGDVDRGLEQLAAAWPHAHALVSVSELSHAHPDYTMRIAPTGYLTPYGAAAEKIGRRQSLEPLFFLDGSLYLSKVSSFLRYRSFHTDRTIPLVMPGWKSLSIDDWVDFISVEAIMTHKHRFLKRGMENE
ncbi:cytidylyltransferase domain-containing protein [Cohnella hongkongensis]|uniref:Cytidylyltransferase domain-containing protein n=1 Tax=Cohnella hongkongensis TaxID=178337 RepID=A0ABV9FK89_9BACL